MVEPDGRLPGAGRLPVGSYEAVGFRHWAGVLAGPDGLGADVAGGEGSSVGV
jgi:hypothetical protein